MGRRTPLLMLLPLLVAAGPHDGGGGRDSSATHTTSIRGAGLPGSVALAGYSRVPDNGSGRGAAAAAPDSAVPNDNLSPAGRLSGGVLEIALEARLAGWRPDPDVDSLVTVQAFAEAGGAVRIPGPLIRVPAGTQVRISVRNTIRDSVLVVSGLRAGALPGPDTVRIPSGASRTVRFTAGAPGTYLYWGTTSGRAINERTGRDSQLNGAIVIDPRGTAPDPAERIFLVSLIDIVPDTTKPPPQEDIWEVAINGRSWPYTERLHYDVGDTVHWRFVNATDRVHPMHLHGFHFRVLAKGDGAHDTTYASERTRLAVTELMLPGSTFRLEWAPTRAGNWLMHCHMAAHITPFPERPDSIRGHDGHDLQRHPLMAMAGLVLGINVTDARGLAARGEPRPPVRHLRLLAQEASSATNGVRRRGFVLQGDGTVPSDSVPVTSPPLLLVRGETTAITVVNRLSEPTSVHWHGMELESVFDGVSGWSGQGTSLAPLLAPGDSFTVQMTPPRAGTFIYHTHMDEGMQLASGMYGPLIVLDPGETFRPETDLVFMIGRSAENGKREPVINGRSSPTPQTLRVGQDYRIRIVNIMPNIPVSFELRTDSALQRWTPISKDGAELPTGLQAEVPASVRLGVGETYDFRWRPRSAGRAELVARGPVREPVRLVAALLLR